MSPLLSSSHRTANGLVSGLELIPKKLTPGTLPRRLQNKIDWIAIELRGIVSPLGGGFRIRNVNSHLGEILSLVPEDADVSSACKNVRTAAAHLSEVRQILSMQTDSGTVEDMEGEHESRPMPLRSST